MRFSDDIWGHILIYFKPTLQESYVERCEKIRVLYTICLVNAAGCRVARSFLLENVTINFLSSWETNTFLQYIYRFPEDAKLVKNVLLIYDDMGKRPLARKKPTQLNAADIDMITRTALRTASKLAVYPDLFDGHERTGIQDEFLEQLREDPRRPFLCEDPGWTPETPFEAYVGKPDDVAARSHWLRQRTHKTWSDIRRYCAFLTAMCSCLNLLELQIHQDVWEVLASSGVEVLSPNDYHFRVSIGRLKQYGWNQHALREASMTRTSTSYTSHFARMSHWNDLAGYQPQSITFYEKPFKLAELDMPLHSAGLSAVKELIIVHENEKDLKLDFGALADKLAPLKATLSRLVIRVEAPPPDIKPLQGHKSITTLNAFQALQELELPMLSLVHGANWFFSETLIRDKLPPKLKSLIITSEQYPIVRDIIEHQLCGVMDGKLDALIEITVHKDVGDAWLEQYKELGWEVKKVEDKSTDLTCLRKVETAAE